MVLLGLRRLYLGGFWFYTSGLACLKKGVTQMKLGLREHFSLEWAGPSAVSGCLKSTSACNPYPDHFPWGGRMARCLRARVSPGATEPQFTYQPQAVWPGKLLDFSAVSCPVTSGWHPPHRVGWGVTQVLGTVPGHSNLSINVSSNDYDSKISEDIIRSPKLPDILQARVVSVFIRL